jgi:hypothetical protein
LKIAIGLRGLFALGSLPLNRKKIKAEPRYRRILLEGDECSIKEIKLLLPGPDTIDFTPVGNEDQIILCEGDQFSFKDIITKMSVSPGKSYKIHSFNSSSIVGSNSSRYTGDVIALSGGRK